MHPLLHYLSTNGILADLTHPDIPRLLDLAPLRRLEKGEYLLREGEICRFLTLVGKGVLVYSNDRDGLETALDFAVEGQWATSIRSLNDQVPADLSIRALEPCELAYLPREAVPQVFALFPELMQVRTLETERSFMRLASHNAAMIQLDARQRYHKLAQERPDLIQRVPQYLIASFLGIQPQSLSRIRAQEERKGPHLP
jgi:CRP/FNR family transcriptional regulator, anaerobic regulatory protein